MKIFYSFALKLIRYFYNNLNDSYSIYDVGISKVSDKTASAAFKNSKATKIENSEIKKNSKYLRKRSQDYVLVNGSLKVKFKNDINNDGELNVNNLTSSFLGRHSIRIGDRPQRCRRSTD
jgi:hypothetical protein